VYSSGIVLSILSIIAMCMTDFEKLKKKDYYIAIFFALVTLFPILVNASSASIPFAVITFFGYLASVTLANESTYKMPIFTSTKFRDIAFDIGLSIAVTIGYFIFMFILGGDFVDILLKTFQTTGVQTTVSNIIWPLATSMSEEVVFRMFLFYVVIKLNKNEKVPFITMVLILSIPFALWHRIDQMFHSGIIYIMNEGIIIYLGGIIFSVVALKRNLFVAILVHFLNNFIIESILF